MRLIDADEFKNFILSLPKTQNGYSDTYDEYAISCFIDSQPTAYNIDGTLKRLKCIQTKSNSSEFNRGISKAIEIVKKEGFLHGESANLSKSNAYDR